jgi:hypothetical protein
VKAAPTSQGALGVRAFQCRRRLPYYRGSDQYRWWILPLPYFIYRGQFFKSDREGLRSRFLRREQWEVSLSAFGNPPVRNDGAREGMPSRDPILELGPALKVYFTPRAAVQKVFSQLAVGASRPPAGTIAPNWATKAGTAVSA